jgi:hypothetical protein
MTRQYGLSVADVEASKEKWLERIVHHRNNALQPHLMFANRTERIAYLTIKTLNGQ